MDDLISRQAAIDFFKDQGMITAAIYMERMPSAQPEIVRCRECKRWNTVLDRNKAEYGLCQNRSQLEATKADFYCADGERRSEDE